MGAGDVGPTCRRRNELTPARQRRGERARPPGLVRWSERRGEQSPPGDDEVGPGWETGRLGALGCRALGTAVSRDGGRWRGAKEGADQECLLSLCGGGEPNIPWRNSAGECVPGGAAWSA